MSRESWPSMLGEMRCTAWHLPEVRTLVNGIIAQAERLAEASLLRGLSDSERKLGRKQYVVLVLACRGSTLRCARQGEKPD